MVTFPEMTSSTAPSLPQILPCRSTARLVRPLAPMQAPLLMQARALCLQGQPLASASALAGRYQNRSHSRPAHPKAQWLQLLGPHLAHPKVLWWMVCASQAENRVELPGSAFGGPHLARPRALRQTVCETQAGSRVPLSGWASGDLQGSLPQARPKVLSAKVSLS